MKLSRLMGLLSIFSIVAVLVGLTATGSGASSHREAPLTSQDPPADNTDVYAFRSPDRQDTVTLLMNVYPFQAPQGGPNFFRFGDDVLYTINIDNDGDALADIEYRFRFNTQIRNPNTFLNNTGPIMFIDEPTLNVMQTYDVFRIEFDDNGNQTTQGDGAIAGFVKTPPNNVGPKSTPNYENLAQQAIFTTTEGSQVFAGQRDDPFFVDVGGLFDLLTIRTPPGNQGGGVDGLSGFNVLTIALQVPINLLTANGAMPSNANDPNAIIGVWETTDRQSLRVLPGMDPSGQSNVFTQFSRLGHPLVNEVVVPLGFKDIFNGSEPVNDAAFIGPILDPEVPKLLKALYNIDAPAAPRTDLVTVFLTGVPGLNQPANVRPSEMLRLNMAVPVSANPNRMGVLGGDLQGYPNGRRLTDDAVDITLRVAAGVLVEGFNVAPNNQLGDGVDANDMPFLPNFPYVGTPRSGFEGTQRGSR